MSRLLLPVRAPTHEVDSQDQRDSGHRCRVPARRRRGGSRGADEQLQPVRHPRGAGGQGHSGHAGSYQDRDCAPSPVPTKTVTAPPAPEQTSAWQQPSSALVAQPKFTNGSAVVAQYYQDITDHNYSAAWAMGGSNVSGGVGYDAWVAGYSTTQSITMYNSSNWGSGEVTTYLSAVQADGTMRTYYGTYYVTKGVITSANVARTS